MLTPVVLTLLYLLACPHMDHRSFFSDCLKNTNANKMSPASIPQVFYVTANSCYHLATLATLASGRGRRGFI